MQNKPSCTSLSSAEQEQLRVWNNTHQPYAKNLRVHQLASRRAETAPEALALTDGSSIMSYKELEQRSNPLARYLRDHGVGPDAALHRIPSAAAPCRRGHHRLGRHPGRNDHASGLSRSKHYQTPHSL